MFEVPELNQTPSTSASGAGAIAPSSTPALKRRRQAAITEKSSSEEEEERSQSTPTPPVRKRGRKGAPKKSPATPKRKSLVEKTNSPTKTKVAPERENSVPNVENQDLEPVKEEESVSSQPTRPASAEVECPPSKKELLDMRREMLQRLDHHDLSDLTSLSNCKLTMQHGNQYSNVCCVDVF